MSDLSRKLTHSLPFFALSAPLLALVVSACQGGGSAKTSASAKSSTDDSGESEFNVDHDAEWNMSGFNNTAEENRAEMQAEAAAKKQEQGAETSKAEEASQISDMNDHALYGARHDLFLQEAEGTPCKCLAVAVGQPGDERFVWAGDAPGIDSSSQLVLALGSEGVSCDFDGAPASYAGYVKEGPNVVILVEAAKEGRPITHGAIVPKPGEGGKLMTKATGKAPYGRANDGGDQCTLR